MSTWQIFSDAGTTFRWEVSSQELRTKPYQERTVNSCPPRLPSMADLLLQGCSRILGNGDENVDHSPMFRTGLGKSVVLKQSSIARALSVLGDDRCDGDIGCSKTNCYENVVDMPMFRSGLGKSVVLKQSSIAKALSVLGNDRCDSDTGQQCRQDNGRGFSNSLFQTASGKAVNISSGGIVRAKVLLGLDEYHENSTFQGFRPQMEELCENGTHSCENLFQLDKKRLRVNNMGTWNATSAVNMPFGTRTNSFGSEFHEDNVGKLVQPETCISEPKPPPIKFHTAGGRSISVSGEALQRAKSLLGDPEMGYFLDKGDADDSIFSFFKESNSNGNSFEKENIMKTSPNNHIYERSEPNPKNLPSPVLTSSKRVQSVGTSESKNSGSNSFLKLDAESPSKLNGKRLCMQKPLDEKPTVPCITMQDPMANDDQHLNPLQESSKGPLVDITNSGDPIYVKKRTTGDIKRLGRRSSISPFKRPRSSKFITPMNCAVPPASNGRSVKDFEYFETFLVNKLRISETMKVFAICVQQNGLNAVVEWVANHYKWIVWKLACYERCYSTKFPGRILTVSNVIEELKYRYEREVNHGHRSAVKRILEGDVSPSSMVILCISAIHSVCDPEMEAHSVATNKIELSTAGRIELTDGWYFINAQLDVLLSQYLAAGKLFVGQKLRICGAGLSGWAGPLSPLEASMATLLLHVNGTHRACWADRLGFSRSTCTPLAFRCIKGNGGPVPRTLVGVTRIYPVLYRERLNNGRYAVRSEKKEAEFMQLYNQRCSNIIEGIISDFQRGINNHSQMSDLDNEEGAKIMKMLETAAEPEVLMAEMSSVQLASFTTYQAKLEAIRQSHMQKSIEEALKAAGLSDREVTPFMRVRVVGLTRKGQPKSKCAEEGLITIWNPADKQRLELAEGHAYAISGLIPLHSDSNVLYLQSRGSTSKWEPLSSLQRESFEPFFSPRESVLLSQLGEVPLSREFDTTALVIHVGQVYMAAQQRRQWVFVTDGSILRSEADESADSLLAISFCSPCTEGDSAPPVNYNLVGSIVGFCNLIKGMKDQVNDLWVAEATENSVYHLNYDHPHYSHLKYAYVSVQRWADNSSATIEKLKKKVLFIVGDSNV
ncbi:hypothetical protein Ancab_032285 [Ancistrocladus abbreviatus]